MDIVRNKLNENPDGIRIDNNLLSGWMNADVTPFGFYKGELFISRQGGTYGGMPGWDDIEDTLCSEENKYCKAREFLELSGRLWEQKKIMSFWKYPPKEKFKEIIDRIGSAINQPNMFNDPEWKVEIITGKMNPDVSDDRSYDWGDHEYHVTLIPLSKYVGSNERSKEELALQHVASPMDKLRRPDKTDFFKIRDKKTKPLAWKQAMQAESLITEDPDGYIEPKTKKRISWASGELDPVVFGWYKGKIIWDDELDNSESGKTHSSLGTNKGPNLRQKRWPHRKKPTSIDRVDYTYPGRLWRKTKMISFWRYPSKKEMPKRLKELGDTIGENFFNNGWRINTRIEDPGRSDYEEAFVSVEEYIGSANASPSDLGKDHAVSPMLKKPVSSGPGKMHSKTPRPLKFQQAMYAESLEENLYESPDMIEADNLKSVTGLNDLGYYGTQAIPFGYWKNKMRVGSKNQTHGNMGKDYYDMKTHDVSRQDFKFCGRAWPSEKIISFWTYPTHKEFQKVLRDIQKENKQKFGDYSHIDFSDPNWSIEVITNSLKGVKNRIEGDWSIAQDSTLIPFDEYTGSANQSVEAQAKRHTNTPMNKLRRPQDSAYFKVGDSKEKPLAWKQAMVKSESLEESLGTPLFEKLLMGEPVTIEELRDVLNKKVLNFEFIKIDGEVRPAKGTTMMKYIPKEEHPTGDHPSSDKVAAFYDLSKDAWRSVSNRSSEIVLVQDKETGKIKVRISDKVPKEEPGKKPEISKVPGADPRPIPPKSEPVVRPSIRPEVTPEIPDADDIDVEDEVTPLDIEDPNITADDVKDKDIIAPETDEPEVELPEPQSVPEVPEETPMEPAVSPSIKPEQPEEELPPEEDITFPDDDEDDVV